jgi:large subunit ribosomal protein L31e
MAPRRRTKTESPEEHEPSKEPEDLANAGKQEEEEEGKQEEEEETPVEAVELPENIVEERIYTVPLQAAWRVPAWRRTPKAMRVLREFVSRHMKPESMKLTRELNERVWDKGIQNPPRRIRIRAVKDSEGVVTVYLHEGGK